MTATTLNDDVGLRASERAGFRNLASRVRRNANVGRPVPSKLATSSQPVIVDEPVIVDDPVIVAAPATAKVSTSACWEGVLNGEEVIMFEVNVPEVIELDSQIEQRAAAAEADRTTRHSALAERAARLLAAIDLQRLEARENIER
jgi:hypothetical protein